MRSDSACLEKTMSIASRVIWFSQMKVGISFSNQQGSVRYIPSTQNLTVDFPDPEIRKKVERYLVTKRVYFIPESQVIDDYREEWAVPTDSLMHMKLALCMLHSKTGVWVDWPSRDENE